MQTKCVLLLVALSVLFSLNEKAQDYGKGPADLTAATDNDKLQMLQQLGVTITHPDAGNAAGQDDDREDIPLVYSVENTGASFPKPVIIDDLSLLPSIQQLPDPFAWADGNGRSTDFADWEKRRNEIKAMIEHYEIGLKPDRPESITATYDEETKVLSVVVTVGENSLTLTTTVNLPAVEPGVKVPAMIGMNGLGSLPADIFSSRNIVQISYPAGQVTTYGNPRNTDPYYKLYPELNIDNTGQYSAWAWGLSRLIDGIEIALADKIDLQHIGVTGCSYAGKMALFCGAFDERVALTVSQESGGGGYTAWRVSQTLGPVENLGATDHNWFSESMFRFAGDANVSKLPIDHHELMAMVAPRALLVLGNTGQVWLADESGYVASRATEKIYETFGIADRFNMLNYGGHNHCSFPTQERAGLEAFVNKFLKGDATVNTSGDFIHSYSDVDANRWFKYWGTDESTDLPTVDVSGFHYTYLEAENAQVGSLFTIVNDEVAMGGQYVHLPKQLSNLSSASTDPKDHIVFKFTLDESAEKLTLFGLMNNATADDDSYFVKLDDGSFSSINGLSTNGAWTWIQISSWRNIAAGEHTLTLAAREDGTKLDRIAITDSPYKPDGKGGKASNVTIPLIYDVENTGVGFSAPTMSDDLASLPFIQTLPDPFAFADGSGRSISFNSWAQRRSEIKAQIEHYEIGTKPNRPENITATYDEETKVLSVVVTVGENSLTLTTTVTLPTVDPDVKVPAMIGMNGTGSLPAAVFTSRNIVQISYPASQVTTYGRPSNTDPYYKLYPELNIDNTGQYSAWAWGLSRLIDGIEIALADKIDLQHIGVTGCSYAGKMALFCGAFDERVALTVSEESGGGGYTAWRVSETVGDVEKLGATDHNWFSESMFNYAAANVPYLPIDHHELMAMVAPRALLVLGNEGQVWLADKSGYVASRAAKNIYETFGIGDRFGMLNTGGHNHCAFPAAEQPGLEAFVDKFLLDDTTVDTDNIFVYPASYETYPYKFWMPWANLGVDAAVADFYREAEADCITAGTDFTTIIDATASNGQYLATGTASAEAAPAKAGRIDIPLTLADHGSYAIYARVNVDVAEKDSLWLSVDSRTFKKVVIPSTNAAWAWVLIGKEDLLTGNHLLTIGAATTTGKIDRIYISNGVTAPTELGGTESECIEIITSTVFDFENSTIAYQSNTDWNLWNGRNLGAIVTTDKHGGEKSLQLKSTSSTDHWRTQAFSPVVELVNGDHYQVTFWAKSVSSTTGDAIEGVMQWGTRNANSLVSSDESLGTQYWGLTNTTGEWTQYSYTDLIAKGTTFQLAIECGSINGITYYIDDIEIKNVDLSLITSIPTATIEGGYSLGQNYPNPAHGITSIPFEIPENSYVSLKVYNVVGQEIATLAGKEYAQGKHVITFESNQLSKGIYIYVLKTNNFSASKKLTVK
ncbi:MAG: Multidomain esterase [Candidatus Ordinivivax streblomastigis]|uniref:Multidomain esterase n=1 Tax=Candidatus Ordinivivax streblomastigis TaxID=2540710 RepID=A0A5M8NW25_9BACT|nr:MAG: Multidomain esterase [Candidatus Ordinivivax streblomastigis]